MFIGNKKCRIYAACGVSQTPKYKIIREEKSRGATIIVATHHKEDLKEVCDVILKIAEGKIVEENENK